MDGVGIRHASLPQDSEEYQERNGKRTALSLGWVLVPQNSKSSSLWGVSRSSLYKSHVPEKTTQSQYTPIR